MSVQRTSLFCLLLLAAPAWAQTTPDADTAASPSEQILVVGQRPGPGLWKVSKDDHVLWIFGTYSPVPKKMEWRAQEAEALLSQSQEYIESPSATADIGFFRALTLLPLAIGIQKNPDGATLKDVLPPDIYARWLPLKEKYIGADEDLERQRPVFVAERLYRAALQHAGLEYDHSVRDTVQRILKKNKIKVTKTDILLPIDEPRAMIKDFKKATLDDAACLAATMDRLETDIDAMRVRANAWAKGDIAEISRVDFSARDRACSAAMLSSPALKNSQPFQTMDARMSEAWIAAAEKALANNERTFSVLPIRQLLDKKGMLHTLEAKGYTVQQPE